MGLLTPSSFRKHKVGVGFADEILRSDLEEFLEFAGLRPDFLEISCLRKGLDLHKLTEAAHPVQVYLYVVNEVDFPAFVHHGQYSQGVAQNDLHRVAGR